VQRNTTRKVERNTTKMVSNFLLLGLACLAAVHGSPYQKEDSLYDDYDGDNAAGQSDEAVVMARPQFITEPLTLMVNEGDVIRLPCKVDRLEGFVMLWKKDANIITVGEQIIDKRVRLEQDGDGSTLVLGPAEPGDEAEYTCQISAYTPTDLTHSVKIRVKPVINVTPEKLVVKEGDDAQFSCTVEAGNPAPEVRWRRRDHKMPDGQDTIQGTSIHFRRVTRHHSGHYICEADNGFGNSPVAKEVRLEVHHAPHVEALSSQLFTGSGREEKLLCTVHSSPKAVVTWTRNGEPVERDSEGLVIESQGNRHSLTVLSVEKKYLGVYACHAANAYGADSKKIEVSGLAKPPTYTSPDTSLHRDSYSLAWSTESHSPVSSFRVSYRKASSPTWTTMEVAPSPSSTSTSWLGTALLSHLSEATQYQARVQTRNQFGFSKPEQVFNFATKGAVPFHQPSTSSSRSLLPSLFVSLLPIMVVSLRLL